MTAIDLISLSYPERQLIVVGDYGEITKVPLGGVKNWSSAKTIGGIALGIGAVGLALTGVGLAVAATSAGTALGAKFFSSKKDTNSDEDAIGGPVLLKVPSKLTSHIQWAMGHPRPNVVYIAHPANPSIYYPATEFHQSIFNSKYGELMRILVALQPREFSIHYEKGWTAEGKLNATVDIAKRMFSGTGKVSVDANAKKDVLCKISFKKPGIFSKNKKPNLPEDLVWLPYEDQWKAFVDARINGKVKDIDLSIVSRDHFGITTDLGVAMKNKGIKVDFEGQYSQFRETIWRVEGAFW